MTLTFNIVENYHHEIDFDSFCTDFLNRVTKKELRKKYDLSNSEWKKYRDMVYEKYPDAPRRTGGRLPSPKKYNMCTRCDGTNSYVERTANGNYSICRRVNGKYYGYGTFKSLNIAEMVRGELVKYNWNKYVAHDLIKEYGMLVSRRCLLSRILERSV